MGNVKVTIIIPVYNGQKTIARTMESLIQQTYANWEAMVINDGSTDETMDVLKRYGEKYTNKILISSHKNIGQAETRNRAIQSASGDYIMFLDADDYIDADYIESYVCAMESGDYDCVVGGYRREDVKGKVVKRFWPSNKWMLYANMGVCSRMIKRKILVENNIKFLNISIGEDSYFNFSLFSRTNKIKRISNEGYVWILNMDSISFSKHSGFTVTNEVISLLNSLADVIDMADEFNQAWLVRYAVWYILFSGRGASSDEFIKNDEILFNWLKSHNVRLKFPVRGVTDGETIKIRFCVAMYLVIRKCGLLYAFSKLYCSSNRK